ncbi:MAG: hypothetical protein Q7S06_04075 [Nanoarchaeota archaeon]|nr:hypothetical protein [Nanoarchaeota archaeon]
MLKIKEIPVILIAAIVMGFAISLLEGWTAIFYSTLAVLAIILINTLAKKIVGYYLETGVEIRFWEIYQYGFKANRHFNKPFPLGAILPLISKIVLFPLKGFILMTSLVFEVFPKSHRAVKRHGLYSFSEMTEYHIGVIAASGIVANLFFAVIGYLLGFAEFSRLSIYYTFLNMIPFSELDGNKVFFGNIIMWSFLASIALIGMFFAVFVI